MGVADGRVCPSFESVEDQLMRTRQTDCTATLSKKSWRFAWGSATLVSDSKDNAFFVAATVSAVVRTEDVATLNPPFIIQFAPRVLSILS